jgi:hypothetical protein
MEYSSHPVRSLYSVLIKVELYAVKKRKLKSESKRERGRRGGLVTIEEDGH